MYRSLESYLKSFTMWILCLDSTTYEVLDRLSLRNARLIPLEQIEEGDTALAEAKTGRNLIEYYWTMTPTLPLFVLKNHPQIESITYLDADILFFKEPSAVYDALDGKSILITKHRYAPKYAHLKQLSGIYNVGILIFRNDDNGICCLEWWRERCNEWCFCRAENGKFGDQKYLDDWPERFKYVVVLEHKGVNLAPWNVDNYTLSKTDGKVMVDEDSLIFFHYHMVSQFNNRMIEAPREYDASKQHIKTIYRPYAKSLGEALLQVRSLYPHFKFGVKNTSLLTMVKPFLSRRFCSVQ